jgi:hypothetical protein
MLALMAGYRTGGGWYKQNEATQNSLSMGSVDHGEILVHSCVKSFQWGSGQAGLSGWYDRVSALPNRSARAEKHHLRRNDHFARSNNNIVITLGVRPHASN